VRFYQKRATWFDLASLAGGLKAAVRSCSDTLPPLVVGLGRRRPSRKSMDFKPGANILPLAQFGLSILLFKKK
jgi:hypothetical protein